MKVTVSVTIASERPEVLARVMQVETDEPVGSVRSDVRITDEGVELSIEGEALPEVRAAFNSLIRQASISESL